MTYGLVWLGPCVLCGTRFSVEVAFVLELERAGAAHPDRCRGCAPGLYMLPPPL